ncbi:MAG: hypothetical protein HC848_02000 [Limnobacter sp.]|nr:hypothetical protein [Limnobacter sp.]
MQTFLSHTIGTLPLEGDFPEIVKLRERAQNTSYLVSAEQRATDMLALLEPGRIEQVPNGKFVEIRSLVQHA